MSMDKMKSYLSSMTQLKTMGNLLGIITISICIFIFVGMKSKTYKCPPQKQNRKIQCLDVSSYQNLFLCNYFIKASYSSCALGNFRNNYVAICALKHVIQQGCRFLDFEVYSLNDDPVVAVSSVSSYTEKGSYNSIPFHEVIECIKNNATSASPSCSTTSGICPNPHDPLILNFRIKTKHVNIYDKMAYHLSTILKDSLLNNQYSLTNNRTGTYDNNIWTTLKIGDMFGKIIILIDASGTLLENSKLYEVANVRSDGTTTNVMRQQNVNYKKPDGSANDEYYISPNHNKINIVFPTTKYSPINYSAKDCFNLGIQVCCMCFQKEDENLKKYNRIFDKERKAFILKNNVNPSVTLYT